MVTKKDLAEGQTFSTRRLLTAFVSGAPGGRELESSKPLRAIVSGIALTALVVAGGFASGMFDSPMPKGWENNTLVVTKDGVAGGSRFIASGGILHPSLNLASARLVVPKGSFKVAYVAASAIASTKRGDTRGIVGAPDALPSPDHLINTGWLACASAEGGLVVHLSSSSRARKVVAAAEGSAADARAPGLLVVTGGNQYLIAGGHHFLISPAHSAEVLQAVGLGTTRAWGVSGRWLNLFPAGSDLAPIEVDGAGSAVPGGVEAPPGAVVGSVLSVTGTGQRYVVDAAGELATLSDFAEPLYRLGSGAGKAAIPVTSAQIQDMKDSAVASQPDDWPKVPPAAAPTRGVACAALVTAAAGIPAHVSLTFDNDLSAPAAVNWVFVPMTKGALVRTGTGGDVQLIDESGTAFPVPDNGEMLGRLGFTAKDVTVVPPAWLNLFRVGPALTEKGAKEIQGAPAP